MPRILVTRHIIREGLDLLENRGWEVTVIDACSGLSLLDSVGSFDAILAMLSDRFDAEVFAAAAGGPLRIVANYAVGYDNIDVAAATAAGVWATNTPDVLTEATAEMAWSLVFAAARRVVEGDRLARSGAWKGWEPTQLIGASVSGATLGIVGCGRIGRAFGRMSTGFRMRILYHARRRNEEFERETGATWSGLDDLLRASDIVSIHLPGGEETRGLISADRIALMKSTAILVNTGRGTVVDEAALAAALREKRIAAAGLDVYEKEPVIHPGLFDLPNVVLAPHLGSATTRSRAAMAARCAENIAAALEGKRPPDALNVGWPAR